jgi:hypothetical protein
MLGARGPAKVFGQPPSGGSVAWVLAQPRNLLQPLARHADAVRVDGNRADPDSELVALHVAVANLHAPRVPDDDQRVSLQVLDNAAGGRTGSAACQSARSGRASWLKTSRDHGASGLNIVSASL